MNIFELAKKYYPRLWGQERIGTLVAAGRLTQAQADEILDSVFNLNTEQEGEGDGSAP